MLVGNILAVTWPRSENRRCSTAADRAFHFVFRRTVPGNFARSRAGGGSGVSVRLWDFLFYASFGFVVTRSVAIAGVLLVFCYLIVPSVAAMMYADRIGPRLAIGWTMGTVVSMLGMYFSVVWIWRPARRSCARSAWS